MQVLILAGGLGTRLKSVLCDIPKPLAPMGSKPFLFYLLEQLKRQDIHQVIISVGYHAEQIIAVLGEDAGLGLTIQYACEESPLGTGGALRNALPLITDGEILVMNGDTFFDIQYSTLEKFHHQWNAGVTVALKYQTEVDRYGVVNLVSQTANLKDIPNARGSYQVASFSEKPEAFKSDGFINGGVYIIRRELLELIPMEPASLERDILPSWVKEGSVYGLPFGGRFIDIGIPADYQLARENLDSWLKLPKYRALFLDRDGVINEDFSYVWRKEEIVLIPRTLEIIRRANHQGWKIIVVTNQAGVARGYYSEKDVQFLHGWMGEQLKKYDLQIDAFYYCPHHPNGVIPEYKKKCYCRKPMPGMVLKAAEEMDISLERSTIIGDHESDRVLIPYFRSIILKPKVE